MAQALFRAADIPNRLMPAAIALGNVDVHDVGDAGHAGDPERDPDAVLRHHAFRGARPWHRRVRHHAGRRAVVAHARGADRTSGQEKDSARVAPSPGAFGDDPPFRERAATASAFDPAEIERGHQSAEAPAGVRLPPCR